jgi:hypothetical protein
MYLLPHGFRCSVLDCSLAPSASNTPAKRLSCCVHSHGHVFLFAPFIYFIYLSCIYKRYMQIKNLRICYFFLIKKKDIYIN